MSSSIVVCWPTSWQCCFNITNKEGWMRNAAKRKRAYERAKGTARLRTNVHRFNTPFICYNNYAVMQILRLSRDILLLRDKMYQNMIDHFQRNNKDGQHGTDRDSRKVLVLYKIGMKRQLQKDTDPAASWFWWWWWWW
jgi:hypothetical protein